MVDPWVVAAAPSGGDDYPSLQTTLTNMGNAGGGLVLAQRGTYDVSRMPFVPNKVTLRGLGRSGTTLRAMSTFQPGSPLLQLGPAGLAFASRVERMTIDCNHIAGVGIYSARAQEMCGADQVTVCGFTDTGVHMDTGCADFAIDSVECYPSSTGANYGIHLHNAGSNTIRNATVGVAGHLTAGVYVNGGQAVLQSIHVENCADGVLFDNARGFASGVSASTVNANVTNLVRSSGQCVTLIDLSRNAAINTFVDDVAGLTVTDGHVQAAVLGDLYAARVHSPQFDALTARVAALEAKV